MLVELVQFSILISFFSNKDHLSYAYPSEGRLLNTNTLDSFKNFDKRSILESSSTEVRVGLYLLNMEIVLLLLVLLFVQLVNLSLIVSCII